MPVNLAFYGAGARARPYLEVLARREDVRVLAVCDPDPGAAALVAAQWGARVCEHPGAMLREEFPDAVWVCVPAPLQGEPLAVAAELGIPFCVEPPGAPDFAAAEQLAAAVARSGLVTAVGHVARQVDVVREAREFLAGQAVPLALGWWLAAPPPEAATALLWEEGCRLLDLLRGFGGEAVSVRAAPAGPQALSLALRLAGGTLATVAVAALALAEPRRELELITPGGYFRFTDGLTALHLVERHKTTILRQANRPHAELVQAFLAAVRDRAPAAVPCPYGDALRTMSLAQAALAAAQSGGEVFLQEALRPPAR
jgi:predicted dehydrogenase